MYFTAYNLWTFTWFVHYELPFRLEGTDKIHTEGLSKFHSNIYSILFECSILVTWYRQRHVTTLLYYHWWEFWWRTYIWIFVFDTVLYQFLETGTSDITFMGRNQELKWLAFSLYFLPFFLYTVHLIGTFIPWYQIDYQVQ